ncbi:hypothetical protein COO60DRAFT_386468 [Scenedesmus sp. NREL 46B-D3]|nr:hypothetical protein COO60DRAFT_386468 [Scenedesmus sp. NREL 46B-D3]
MLLASAGALCAQEASCACNASGIAQLQKCADRHCGTTCSIIERTITGHGCDCRQAQTKAIRHPYELIGNSPAWQQPGRQLAIEQGQVVKTALLFHALTRHCKQSCSKTHNSWCDCNWRFIAWYVSQDSNCPASHWHIVWHDVHLSCLHVSAAHSLHPE